MADPVVSIVIPAFNEEATVGRVLEGVKDVMKEVGAPYEVIVVNDGSTDRTAEIVKDYNVILVHHEVNLGKGAALKDGFMKSRGKIVVTLDADGSHNPEDISKLILPLINCNDIDVTIGARFINRTGKSSTSKLHIVGNKIINVVILLMTGKYVSDSQTGFRAFRRDVLRKIPLNGSRYEIESEMTVGMLKRNMRILEVPINCVKRNKGYTKISSLKDGFKILKSIFKAAIY